MLLAGREREDEAALALGVDGFASEAAGHLANMLLAAGEESDIRSAKLQADANRLALANDDVGAHLTRRLDEAKRNRLGDDGDQQGASRVCRLRDRHEVRDPAEDVGILDNDRARVGIDAADE